MPNRPTFKNFKEKALQNKEVKEEYDTLAPLYALKKQLVAARLAKGGNTRADCPENWYIQTKHFKT